MSRRVVVVLGLGAVLFASGVWAAEEGLPQNDWDSVSVESGRALKLTRIKCILDDVEPLSLAEWERRVGEGVDRDREIERWLHVAEVYAHSVESGGMPAEKRREVFQVLNHCVNGTYDLSGMALKTLSLEEAREVVQTFYEG